MTEVPDLTDIANWPVIDATGDDDGDPVVIPELASWPAVELELVAVGEWSLSTGVANFTAVDLAEACAAARCPAVGQPVLKLGHHDPRFDGEPAIGWVASMRLNDTQTKLVGDFTSMPGWLAAILPSAYPERSVEASFDFTCQIGHVHPFVITAVALLGVTPPGVGAIASLNDVAALYGVDVPSEPEPDPDAAAARPFTLYLPGGAMPNAQAAGVVPTVDDIRRAYYESADWSAWIVEVQLSAAGPVLIVIDDSTGQLTRVPVTAKEGGSVEFGEPAPVLVSYVDAPAAAAAAAAFPAGRKVAAAWPSRRSSRDGMLAAAIASHSTATSTAAWDGPAAEANLNNDDGASDYRGAYAWADPDGDADTKDGYRFIHHFVDSSGNVGAASTVGCSAGIGVLNGGRGGTTVPDADVAGIWNHLAKHLTDADLTPPELNAGAAPQILPAAGADAGVIDDPDLQGAQKHGTFDGEHEHPHADGSGGTHFHMHTHTGSATHDHDHDDDASAGATPGPATTITEGSAGDMEFSDTQLAGIRTALGLPADAEVTPDQVAQAMTRLAEAGAPAGVITASAPELPDISDGAYLVDGEIIKGWQNRAAAGDEAVRQLTIRERDTVLAAAVSDGKFPQSRLGHYETMWNKDPDGTRKYVDSLAAGLVPMRGPAGQNPGYDAEMPGDFDQQAAYRQLYGDDESAVGIGTRR